MRHREIRVSLRRREHHRRKRGARLENTPDLGHGLLIIRNQHEAKSRDGSLERIGCESQTLSVRDPCADISQAGMPCGFGGDLQHARRDVRRKDVASGADALGSHEGRIASTGSHIEHSAAGVDPGELEHPLSGWSERLDSYGLANLPLRGRGPRAPRSTFLGITYLFSHGRPSS